MRIHRIVCLAAITVLALDSQDSVRAGNQIFRIPPGWVRTDAPGSVTLSPANEPKNMVVLLLSGRPLTGDFRATFDQDVRVMNGSLRIVTPGQVQSRRTPDGVDLLATTVELQAGNGPRSWRYCMAANARGRFEILVFLAASQALFQRYWPAVQQFIGTWSFANLTNAAASPPPPPGDGVPAAPSADAPESRSAVPNGNRLEGVYGGYKFIYTTVLGAVQRKAVNDYFSFFSDGTVYWGLPQSGLAGFNMARECPKNPIYCGTYQVSGDRVALALNRGTYRQAGTRTPAGLHIEDRDYTLQGDPAKAATRGLEGVFVRADAQPGEDLARKFIRFTRDGQFMDQGIVLAVTNSEIINGNPRFERPAGSGTYRLAPYTLILRYADGYQRPLALIVDPADLDKPSLSRLLMNTYTLVRRN
jgi:hypothetical protein